ncbi:MAG: BlaI/MecI/CopY family transcriptional regulator [Clostridia bacterium]|jgi:predicted transcriptional regulator|nr:BlaI/MecI/CopY family transcriptional regulator [Clostridia bacterium]
MSEIKRLPDSELEIMMIIWGAGKPVTSAFIMENLREGKNWANTTVLNFLNRLVDRGFLRTARQGRFNYYEPLVKESEYLQKESKSFLERMHIGSLKSFVAALYDGDAIDEEDLAELKKYVEEISNKYK